MDNSGSIVINKAILVSKGYNQEEGINYDEIYTSVARLEAIRILLAIASMLNFKFFQMDMEITFLNWFIKEEVYVEQPPRFKDFESPYPVFELMKALYRLKQAPRSWYRRLSQFLMKSSFQRGKHSLY